MIVSFLAYLTDLNWSPFHNLMVKPLFDVEMGSLQWSLFLWFCQCVSDLY